jgi:serine/threonine protein kinase
MIKICDFGSSTHTPLLKETQSSPQPSSTAPIDFKSDIWSIGKLIYELLYGIIPEEVSTKDCVIKIVSVC